MAPFWADREFSVYSNNSENNFFLTSHRSALHPPWIFLHSSNFSFFTVSISCKQYHKCLYICLHTRLSLDCSIVSHYLYWSPLFVRELTSQIMMRKTTMNHMLLMLIHTDCWMSTSASMSVLHSSYRSLDCFITSYILITHVLYFVWVCSGEITYWSALLWSCGRQCKTVLANSHNWH